MLSALKLDTLPGLKKRKKSKIYFFRNLADLAKKELEARKNGKVAGRIVHDENEKLKHEK